MTALADVLRFVSLFCAGIAAGTWLVVQRALVPMRRELPPAGVVHLHAVTSREIDRYMPPCTAAATLAGLLVVVLGSAPDRAAAAWTAAGFAFMFGAALVSMLNNMPINRRIAAFPPGTAPDGLSDLQRRWAAGNLARTLMGLAGFASYVLAVL